MKSSFFCCLLDHPQSFEVKPLTAAEGDDVSLICQGTRFLYDRLNWYDSQGHLVQDDSSIQISPYSVSLSLRLKNVSRNHTNEYACRAINLISKNVVNATSNLIVDGELLLLSQEPIYHLLSISAFIHVSYNEIMAFPIFDIRLILSQVHMKLKHFECDIFVIV